MNDKIIFGQYVFRDSIIHKLDARSKLLILVLTMIAAFIVPQDNFIVLALVALIPLIGVAFSKVSIFKYLKSLKQIVFIMLFSFIFQMITSAAEMICSRVASPRPMAILLRIVSLKRMVSCDTIPIFSRRLS